MPRASEPQTVEKYGMLWPIYYDPVQCEIDCIRNGGSWKSKSGKDRGMGLFFHYRKLQSLLWPEDVHHTWSDLMLKSILEHRITVVQGPKDSSKTRSMAKYALTDYFCFPNETLILLSSTDLRGLELRVWGDLKHLFQRAKQRCKWLPGQLLDSKHSVSTDNLKEDEVRDLRKGCVCFVKGTLVDTPAGPKPIETLKVSDWVVNAFGVGVVKETQRNIASELVRVYLSNGTTIDCTPEHPFFTKRGWTKAVALRTSDKVFSAHETMRLLRRSPRSWLSKSKTLFRPVSRQASTAQVRFLRQQFSSVEAKTWPTRKLGQVLQYDLRELLGCGTPRANKKSHEALSELWEVDEEDFSRTGLLFGEMPGFADESKLSGVWKGFHVCPTFANEATDAVLQSILQVESEQPCEWEQMQNGDEMRTVGSGPFPGFGSAFEGLHRQKDKTECGSLARNRHCVPEAEISCGDRWWSSSNTIKSESRCAEDRESDGTWVVRVEILKPEDIEGYSRSDNGVEVFNLSVSGHPSYSVNGAIVHNCVPVMSAGGSWQGIQKWVGIKQKRRRLLADECFPAGTMVDTPSGAVPIETVIPGQVVTSALGPRRVIACKASLSDNLVKIKTRNGRTITCTGNHPFFTQKGWIKACNLTREHYMMSCYETMSLVQEASPAPSKIILQQCLLSELQANASVDKKTRCVYEKVSRCPSRTSGSQPEKDDGQESDEEYRHTLESVAPVEGDWMEADGSRRKRHWSNESRSGIQSIIPRIGMELSHQNRNEGGERLSNLLQSRSRLSKCKVGNRIGRSKSLQLETPRTRPEKNQILRGDWVDCVEVSEYISDSSGEPVQTDRRSVVYNLQVEGHPSYSVNGFVVHNCQFYKPNFLESLANLNSGDFKGVFVGNPLGDNDPLDKLAEPKEGWGTEGEVTKTVTWLGRFNESITVNLVGTDSPNFEQSQEPFPKYPFLVNRKSIEDVVAFYGMDSLTYHSQCLGIRKPGLSARRVITRALCKKFGAFYSAVWQGTQRTNVYAVDAAYGGLGGDRCIGIRIEFGKDVDGKTIIKVYPSDLIPVSVKIEDKSSEDQIAEWVKQKCETDGIPANHVFYDATGRGSLGTSFARIWSAYVNPVEFGGAPTDRPVSTSLQVRDTESGQMRLKQCDEHYSKFVSELWFSVAYVIESGQMRELPEDVMDEGCRREWKLVRGNKTEVETKDEMRERVNISPDKFDALATAVEGARRLGFTIDKLSTPKEAPKDDTWKDVLKKRAERMQTAHELNYA